MVDVLSITRTSRHVTDAHEAFGGKMKSFYSTHRKGD